MSDTCRRFVVLFLFGFTSVALGQNGVVDSVDSRVQNGNATVTVRFTLPLRYYSHSPLTPAKVVNIQLRAIPMGTPPPELYEEQRLRQRPTADVPLEEINYDGSASEGPMLTLRFASYVQVSVQDAPDMRGLVFTLSHIGKLEGPQVAPAVGAADIVSPAYAINLISQPSPILPSQHFKGDGVADYYQYVTEEVTNGQVWYRLRIGFFPIRTDAQLFLPRVLDKFPFANVTETTLDERALVLSAAAKPTVAPAVAEPVPSPVGTGGGGREQWLMDAKNAITSQDYPAAIRLLSKVLRGERDALSKEAQELLGLSRERNGQLAHARAEYELYLKLYPEGEDARRVSQRLAGLLTARESPKGKLRAVAGKEGDDQWRFYGGLSQNYLYNESSTDSAAPIVTAQLNTDFDMAGRVHDSRYDVLARVALGQRYDTVDGEVGYYLSTLYVDSMDRQHKLSTRAGRQSRSDGGVLGRFDGAWVGYEVAPGIHVNGVVGFPVESSKDTSVDTNKQFFGANLDWRGLVKDWDMSAFAIHQDADGFTDRNAVGGEVRYFKDDHSVFGLLDYDTFYGELNMFMLMTRWTLADGTAIQANWDQRKSPLMATSNALQGQSVGTLSALRQTYSAAEIYQLARDRAADSRTLMLGLSRKLDARRELSGELTLSSLGATPASGGVAATAKTDLEINYHAQLLISDFIMAHDSVIFGVSIAGGDLNSNTTLSSSVRLPSYREWSVNPYAQLAYRENKVSGGHTALFRPGCKASYQLKKQLQLDVEGTAEWSNATGGIDNGNTVTYELNVGYRYTF